MSNLINKKISQQKGFTLIELLVVVAIISLLSSVVMSSVSAAREKAEWRAFDSTIIEVVKAINLYRTSENGAWPDFMEKISPHRAAPYHLNYVVAELNSAGLYPSPSIEKPHNFTIYVVKGPKYDGSIFDCYSKSGSPQKDAYYILFNYVNSDEYSNIFTGKLYEEGVEKGAPCATIR